MYHVRHLSFQDAASVEIAFEIDVNRTKRALPGENLAYSKHCASAGWGNDTQLGHDILSPSENICPQAVVLIIVILFAKHGIRIPSPLSMKIFQKVQAVQ